MNRQTRGPNQASAALHQRLRREERALSLRGCVAIGGLIAAFAAWSAVAPLAAAVVVAGTVGVESERKTVQHLEGGIIKAIHVRPGSVVRQGDPLILLETVQIDATVAALRVQLDAEVARAARLEAERAGAARVSWPAPLLQQPQDPVAAAIVDTEAKLFQARRRLLDEQIVLLKREIVEVRDQIRSLEAQRDAAQAAIASAKEQLQLNESLRAQNFVSHARVLEFQALLAERQQRHADAGSQIAQARQKIVQSEQKIAALQQNHVREASEELRATQRRIDELRERLRPTQDALTRTTIVAPIAGEVVDLKVHTVGGVIGPKEPLLEIVPSGAPLQIKGKVRTDDVTHLRVGAPVAVQLIAYKRRTTPVVEGTLVWVSPDALTEMTPAGPLSFFEVRIRVERDALERAGGLEMSPGMPVEAYVETEKRTLVEYLVQPVVQSMRRAHREY
jgi:HlyD family type I secretion membrane fusion protein